ncbi:hypothetical protein DMENIID0001_064030 [Sergentomyia squamirostris]
MNLCTLLHNKQLLLLFIFLEYLAIASSHCTNCTENSFTFPEILSRKRRYLVFPPGAIILCTLSVVKAIMISSPRGYNMILETDFYYPLPDKVIFPKRKTPQPAVPATTTPKPTPEPIPELHFVEYPHSHEIFNDVSHIYDRVFSPHRRKDNDVFWSKNASYKKKYKNPSRWIPKGYYKNRGRRSDFKDDHFHQHKGHKDRRDLYKSIEKFLDEYNFGLEGRSCILRTICEAQNLLMPKGLSLFHDIFRTLFSLPQDIHYGDEYKDAMDSDNCLDFYAKKCPVSLLNLFLKTEKIL